MQNLELVISRMAARWRGAIPAHHHTRRDKTNAAEDNTLLMQKKELQPHKPPQTNNILSSCSDYRDILNRTPPDAQAREHPVMLQHMHFLLLAVVCADGSKHATAIATALGCTEA